MICWAHVHTWKLGASSILAPCWINYINWAFLAGKLVTLNNDFNRQFYLFNHTSQVKYGKIFIEGNFSYHFRNIGAIQNLKRLWGAFLLITPNNTMKHQQQTRRNERQTTRRQTTRRNARHNLYIRITTVNNKLIWFVSERSEQWSRVPSNKVVMQRNEMVDVRIKSILLWCSLY